MVQNGPEALTDESGVLVDIAAINKQHVELMRTLNYNIEKAV